MDATRIPVRAGKPYDVVIGRGILPGVGKAVSELGKPYDTVALISDDNVSGLYAETVRNSLSSAGYRVLEFIFPHGEASKSIEVLTRICGFMSDNFVTRKSLVAALGGGVTGDLAGFSAAVYQRGIDYIQIPTTLLAAIDSSVGGKTAVNIPQGKNLLGAFWQPELVWCDADALSTLSVEQFREGVAEAVKYGCILDEDLFAAMDGGFESGLDGIIARCVELKAQVVRQDERDNGVRAILNFGHTLGHGIEKLSGFCVSHGMAVAMGMLLAARAGEAAGITEAGTADKIDALLRRNGISGICPYPVRDVCAMSLGDKKREGKRINLILLEKIGKSVIHSVPADGLEAFFCGS